MNQLLESLAEHTFSVSEYLELINGLITPLDSYVEGEVLGYKEAGDWIFFDLKDAEVRAVLGCGLHRSGLRRMGVILEDGMHIKVLGHGKITPKSGRFGFWVDEIELMGEGTLKRAYELLRKQFTAEGLFERKRALPECIEHIGVISSRDGVVIHDLLKNLKKRGIHIDFLHSAVDGEKAAPELVRSIEYFSHLQEKEKPQALVIIRGGGSLESLQAFNNERVCRAIFACPVPVIAGIGHDVDVPLATLVADASASTPTAVAHLINQTWDDLLARIPELYREMQYGVERRITGLNRTVTDLSRTISHRFNTELTRMRYVVSHFEQLVALVDPTRILKRGYSIVYAVDGTVVRSVRDLKEGDSITATLADGTFDATVQTVLKT